MTGVFAAIPSSETWHITTSGQLWATVKEKCSISRLAKILAAYAQWVQVVYNDWFLHGNKYLPQSYNYLLKILALSVIFLKLSSFTLFSFDTAQREYNCLRIWTGGRVASELKTCSDPPVNQADVWKSLTESLRESHWTWFSIHKQCHSRKTPHTSVERRTERLSQGQRKDNVSHVSFNWVHTVSAFYMTIMWWSWPQKDAIMCWHWQGR